jgi:hypothetical protein
MILDQISGQHYTIVKRSDPNGQPLTYNESVAEILEEMETNIAKYRLVTATAEASRAARARRVRINRLLLGQEGGPFPPLSQPPKLANITASIKIKADPFTGIPTKWGKRTIIALGNTGSSPCYSTITKILSFLEIEQAKVWEDLFYDLGTPTEPRTTPNTDYQWDPTTWTIADRQKAAAAAHPIWIAKNSRGITAMIDKYNSTRGKKDADPLLQVNDFSDLYGTIGRPKLIEAIEYFLERIASRRRREAGPNKPVQNALKLTPGEKLGEYKIEWTSMPTTPLQSTTANRNSAKCLVLTIDEVIDMIKECLGSTYFTFMDIIVNQSSAVAQGCEPGVFFANYYLCCQELAFVDRMLHNKQWEILNECKLIKRYIDDITAINCPNFQKWKHCKNRIALTNGTTAPGIYHNETTLNFVCSINNQVGSATEHAVIVDSKVSFNARLNKIVYEPYDKRSDPVFNPTRLRKYPLCSSSQPFSDSINIVVSESHRAKSVSSHYTVFAEHVGGVIHELAHNGYPLQLLLKAFHTYLSNQTPIYPRGPGADPYRVSDKVQEWVRFYHDHGHPLFEIRNNRLNFPTVASNQPYMYLKFKH